MMRKLRLAWCLWRARRRYRRWAMRTADLIFASTITRTGGALTVGEMRRAMDEAEARMRAGAEAVATEAGIWVGEAHHPPGDVVH
jgi:hypothetical protein